MNNRDENYEKGLQVLRDMAGEAGVNTVKQLENFYPDFGKFLISFGFGEIYSREALNYHHRELITLTALISQGAFEQLPFHLNAALNVGVTPKEIVELIIHCAAYVGFPKACSAIGSVIKVFEQRNIAEI